MQTARVLELAYFIAIHVPRLNHSGQYLTPGACLPANASAAGVAYMLDTQAGCGLWHCRGKILFTVLSVGEALFIHKIHAELHRRTRKRLARLCIGLPRIVFQVFQTSTQIANCPMIAAL